MNAAWQPIRDRITRRIASSGDCWLWAGATDASGYGRMAFRGRNCRVMRVAWSAFNERDWPEGQVACHTCDVRLCVNPAHIEPGTVQRNNQEAWDRGAANKRRLINRAHCRHGHPLGEGGLVTYPCLNGKLRCRKCSEISSTKNNQRRRAAK